MNRVISLAVLCVMCVLFAVAPSARADAFNPKEAITGVWMVDAERLFNRLSEEPDEQRRGHIEMAGIMSSKYMWQIREDGALVLGGVEAPVRYLFEVDDEGLLWMLEARGDANERATVIRFEGPDRLMMKRDIAPDIAVETPFVRVFPAGLVESGDIPPGADEAISGFWAIDEERLPNMAWIKAMNDPEQRERAASRIKEKMPSLGFKDGVMPWFIEGDSTPTHSVNYEVRCADERVVGVWIQVHAGDDSEWSLMRIEIVNDDHLLILWPYAAPGPVPLVRSADVWTDE